MSARMVLQSSQNRRTTGHCLYRRTQEAEKTNLGLKQWDWRKKEDANSSSSKNSKLGEERLKASLQRDYFAC